METRPNICFAPMLLGVATLVQLSFVAEVYGSQQPNLSQTPFSGTTIIVRFEIAPNALSEVRNSAELIDALRDHLIVEGATPLDSALTVHLSGRFGQNPDNSYEFGSGIILQIAPNQRTIGDVGSFPMRTYGDWDTDEAWQYFRDETETGLLNSLAASGGFVRNGNGRVPLTVSAIHAGPVDEMDPGDLGAGMLLELWPERLYKTESRFGSPTPPEGYTEEVQVVVLQLMPAPAGIVDTVAGDSRGKARAEGDSSTVVLSQETLDRLTGEYGEGGRSMVFRNDGEHLVFSNPDEPESEWTLYPLSEKDFWADFNGVRVELSFSRDDSGRAFAVTIRQEGFGMTLPRIP